MNDKDIIARMLHEYVNVQLEHAVANFKSSPSASNEVDLEDAMRAYQRWKTADEGRRMSLLLAVRNEPIGRWRSILTEGMHK